MSAAPLLAVEALSVSYSLPGQRLLGARRRLHAVDRTTLAIAAGETFGLVGETGCGKSSLSRAIYGLTPIAAGRVRFGGVDLTATSGKDARVQRRGMQMIFQDPGGSLNPRMRVEQIIAEPLEINRLGSRRWRRDKVADVLAAVGLGAGGLRRHPHQLSGGQRQRVAIARAVVADPALIIADEPVSALDVSLQAQILNLIAALRDALGLALLFVSHDLAVVEYLCDRVGVMYLGRIVETGRASAVLADPAHPYTRELVASSPRPDPRHPIRPAAKADEPANPADPPSGCRYHPRCLHATDRCRVEVPELRGPAGGPESAGGQPMPVQRLSSASGSRSDRADSGSRVRQVACHHAEQIA